MMKILIDDKRELNFPLYHGTSSYFIPQIKEHGFGGYRDQAVFSLEVLRDLADALDDNATDWWVLESIVVAPMLQQRVTKGGFNFRYGSTYLTPSKLTAYNYANSNFLGSELLTTIYKMYTELASINPAKAKLIIPSDHPLLSVFYAAHSPVIIVLEGLKADRLKTEQGESIEKQLREMNLRQSSSGEFDIERVWQQFNFELIGSVDWSLIKVASL